jgi:hypothetical protein
MTDEGNNGAAESLRHRKSRITEVQLSDLYVDNRFQRALNPNKVTKIKDTYHPQGIGYLLAAGVDGHDPAAADGAKYAVIDGQTRWKALHELYSEVLEGRASVEGLAPVVSVELFDNLTIPEAALLFRLRNDQRPVSPRERDRIMVTEGNPTMVEVVRQSADAGYVVFPEDTDEAATMPHLTEGKRIVTWGTRYKRPQLLTEALTVQAQAFGTQPGDVDKQILQATALLLRKNENLNEDELARVMAAIRITGIRAQAEALAARINKRVGGCIQIVLAEAYNKGKRGADKIRP